MVLIHVTVVSGSSSVTATPRVVTALISAVVITATPAMMMITAAVVVVTVTVTVTVTYRQLHAGRQAASVR